MATVQRAHDPALGEIVTKEACDPSGRARLAREAAVLERARHPGVVQLLRHDDHEDRAVLVTRDAGARTVEELSDLGADQVAAFGAAVAQTLADLHRLGVSHGAVRAEHVVVSDQGQPVLCGFGDAGLVDPPEGQWGGFDPAADVGALADLLAGVLAPAEGLRRWTGGVAGLLGRADERSMEQLAEELAAMARPIQPPLRRPTDTSGSAAPTIDLTEPTRAAPALEHSATRPAPGPRAAGAADGMPAAWLEQQELDDHPFWTDPVEPEPQRLTLGDAAAVDGLFAPGRSFGPRPPRPDATTERLGPARRWLAGAALALLALLAGATTVAALGGAGDSGPGGPSGTGAKEPAASSGSIDGRPPPLPAPAAAGPEAAAAQPPGAPPAAPGAPAEPAAPAAPAAPDRGVAPPEAPAAAAPPGCPASHDEAAVVGVPASCADQLAAAGNQVSVGPLRWVVGSAGDVAVAGDFDCDGWLEVASLAPTGDVAVFDRWAGAGQEPAGRVVERVTGARGLTAPAEDGCHQLVVERAGLPPVTVPVPPGP